MTDMHPILENLLIMVLTILVLLAGAYVLLLILDWGLRLKSGTREQEGLTRLWATAQKQQNQNRSPSSDSDSPAEPS